MLRRHLKIIINIRLKWLQFNPISIQRQLDGLSEIDADIFRGYAAGMNAWIEEVKKNTDRLMPKEFINFGFEPELWSAFDVAMIFVGSMANRFGDFNTELANEQIYNVLAKNGCGSPKRT